MKVVVNGMAVEYTDEGQGPVILMLHGWKDDLRTFGPLVPILAQRHRVVRLDLPGFGQSDMPKSAWRLDEYVDLVAAFIEKLQLEVDVLIGHSLGGRITLKGVARGVFKPRKIVLIASAGIAKRKTLRNEMLRAVAKAGKAATAMWPLSLWRTTLRRKLYARIGSDYFAAGGLKGTFINIVEEDLQDSAGKIAVPALLIWGSDDTTTPLTDGERLQTLIPGARLETFDGTGHFVHRDRAQEVAQLIVQFI